MTLDQEVLDRDVRDAVRDPERDVYYAAHAMSLVEFFSNFSGAPGVGPRGTVAVGLPREVPRSLRAGLPVARLVARTL